MNTETIQRAKAARFITANPWKYKICDGCESIVKAVATECPHCKSYRFEVGIDAVAAHAKLLLEADQ